MANGLKNLCRLCAKKEYILKDLNHEDNKNMVNMIRDLIQIVITENDPLPTKICLNCEEKMVSFQLFILECYKVQENLQNMCVSGNEHLLKDEDNLKDLVLSEIKSEVKCEMDEQNESNATFEDYETNAFERDDVSTHSDSSDEITLALLRENKEEDLPKNDIQPKVMTEYDIKELEKLKKNPKAKLMDYVKMICDECSNSFRNWEKLRLHFIRIHLKRPYVFCVCGYPITSKSAIYRHVSGHKAETRENMTSDEYEKLKAGDFIKFTCDECKSEYSSWYKLNSHTMRKHKTTPVVHCICGISMNSRTVMYKHIQDHRVPNVLHCDECPKIAKTPEELEKHKLRHIPKSKRSFQCSSCDKVFSSKDCLKSHERSHIPIEQRKIYECDVCHERFTTRSSAMSHKRVVHDKIKSYICDLCGYACGTNGELRQHRAIHSDDKPFVCRKCSKAFKTYSNLKTHMDTHEDTSYVCFVCSRVLNSRRTLRKHLLVHDEKATHVCNYCNKAFKRRQTLKVHLAMHTGDKPLSCKWCDERFAYASTLRSHRLRAHPDKTAAHFTNNYNQVQQIIPQDYLKNEAGNINVTKSDV